MTLKLNPSTLHNSDLKITITGSKSESNRLLLLQALYPELEIKNISNSDDSQLMQKALASTDTVIDIHHAGTAMRFLTAYFATQGTSEITLTGSSRMQERPIKILVDALNTLGADISYIKSEGFPPLKIRSSKLQKHKVTLPANVSSQYISALLLVAPKLEHGLELTLDGKITSIPYIMMTLALLNDIGVKTNFENNVIKVAPLQHLGDAKTCIVESDWSSASYYYSCVALSKVGAKVTLSAYKQNSLQGDSVLAELYKSFGVETTFNETSVMFQKTEVINTSSIIQFNLVKAPDIAQTIAVTAFGLGLECHLTGLHTLKIKETDRLVALKTEIEKLGGDVYITDDSFHLQASKTIHSGVAIDTYHDHRMAMAFAPLALKTELLINDAKVVSKSYPDFWKDLKSIGFNISE